MEEEADEERQRSSKIARIEDNNNSMTDGENSAQQHSSVWREDDHVENFLGDRRWKLEPESINNITQFLKGEGITTLKEWKDRRRENLDEIVQQGVSWKTLVDMVYLLASEIQEPLADEARLDGRFLGAYKGEELNNKTTESNNFVSDAVSVKPPHFQKGREGHDIRLVLGPSGSGKTVYALNELAFMRDEMQGNNCPPQQVCVYFSLQNHPEIHPDSLNGATEDDNNTKKIATYIAGKTMDTIKIFLKKKHEEKKSTFNMLLSVILDEAAACGSEMGKKDVLSTIFEELSQVATHVRLIVVGTGMDVIAVNLSSSTDVLKYRMQPWDEKKFHYAVRKRVRSTTEAKLYIDAIGRSPILRKLITNARCAIFTYEAVARINRGYHSVSSKGFVSSIVHEVLGHYVSYNAIAQLDDSRRRLLAYAVFHELKETNESGEARIPHIAKLEHHVGIKRQALGVLDVHVESEAGGIKFLEGYSVSVSVTPAMSMVLYSLLGVEATVYDSWEGLEAIAWLHAVYLEVVSNDDTRTKGVKLARLTRAVPAPNATKTFRIPSPNGNPTVYINDEKAPFFFDAISKHRYLKSKYSKSDQKVVIDLAEEMQKSGLVKELICLNGKTEVQSQKTFDMGKAVTSAFLHSWSTDPIQEDSGTSSSSKDAGGGSNPSFGIGATTKVFSPAFVFSRSDAGEAEVDPNDIVCSVTDDDSFSFRRQRDEEEQQSSLPTEPAFTDTFTMIFITNAKSILLKVNGNDEFVLDDTDIDRDGSIDVDKIDKKGKYESMIAKLKLRENVQIRFAFTG